MRRTRQDPERPPSGREELREVRRQHTTRTAIEAGRIAALQVFVDDPAPELALELHALVEMRESTAHQDGHRLDLFGCAEELQKNVFAVVELSMNLIGEVGTRFELLAQMDGAIADVARFVLHTAAEDFRVDAARRDELALPEHRQHEALAEQMEAGGLRRKARRIEDALER